MRRIAILIIAHNRPKQLLRLIESLDIDRFDFFIHIDGKTEISQFSDLMKLDNVIFLKKRVRTFLDDFSLVEATMNLLEEALSRNYVYYCLLSGQDYPIKSPQYIYDKLISSYPMNWIDAYPIFAKPWFAKKYGKYRYNQKWRRLTKSMGRRQQLLGKSLRGLFRIVERVETLCKGSPNAILMNKGYTLSTGSHFWMITDRAATYIYSVYKGGELNEIFRNLEVPEECFCQTVLLHNSLFSKNIPDCLRTSRDKDLYGIDLPHLRYIKWYEHGKHSTGHPFIIKDEDFSLLKRADALFARKFDIDVDSRVLDLIDQYLLKI